MKELRLLTKCNQPRLFWFNNLHVEYTVGKQTEGIFCALEQMNIRTTMIHFERAVEQCWVACMDKFTWEVLDKFTIEHMEIYLRDKLSRMSTGCDVTELRLKLVDSINQKWKCILTVEHKWYCDGCPVSEKCPYVSKRWSK